MAIPKQTISWPISGGLQGKTSPFAVQPGSHLTLDDVIQERLNEWRRRNGFTQSATDTYSLIPSAAPFVGQVSPSGDGMYAIDRVQSGVYRPTQASNRWTNYLAGSSTAALPICANSITRSAVIPADATTIGFCSTGSFWMVAKAHVSGGVTVTVVDVAGETRASRILNVSGVLRVRCAATSTHLTAIMADTAGNIISCVVPISTCTIPAATTIKTGGHATLPFLDAMYYTGNEITIVVRMAAGGFQFIEYNPSTGTLATDVNVAGTWSGCLSLVADPGANSVRWVGCSDATNTNLYAMSAAGATLSAMVAEAVVSTQITGCITNQAGSNADWALVYQTAAGAIRYNKKTSGVIGTPAAFGVGGLTIDSQGWGEPGDTHWHMILGCHSTNVDDPQDTWVHVTASFTAATSLTPQSPIVPLQAAVTHPIAANLYQVTRESARTFSMALPVLSHYSNASGVVAREYSVDVFKQKLLTSADIGTTNTGPGVIASSVPLVPCRALTVADDELFLHHGLFAPPTIPVLTPAVGGALTLLGEYQYCSVLVVTYRNGLEWRSPPSVPARVVLTGAQQQVSVGAGSWPIEGVLAGSARPIRTEIYRTMAGGSKFRRITLTAGVDGTADANIVKGEPLYTHGEAPTAITPRPSHVFTHDDRLWLINADYRTEVGYSKNLRPGRMPEFTNEGVVDQDDEFGDHTGGCSLGEGRAVLFKRNALYFVTGKGLGDDAGGEQYNVDRIDGDAGSMPGSPIVVAGNEAYFVSERGIYRVNLQAQVEFIGAPVDQYLNQPLVQTRETVYDGCFVSSANEVRFVTTNYILVFNRTFNTWTRWNLAGMRRCLVVDGRMVLFKGSDGTMWREGDHTQLTDQGVAFPGEIRSAWIRIGADGTMKTTPAQHGIRLYRGRAIMTRTAGGANATLIGKIYTDNSDASPEVFTSAAIPGATLTPTGEMHPLKQKCTSFSFGLTLPSGDVTVRLEGWSAVVGIRPAGELRLAAGNKWS